MEIADVELSAEATYWGEIPEVGRCRLTVANPELKARLVSEYSLVTKM
jgi:hypothetical protein